MAYSSASLTADEIAWAADGLPALSAGAGVFESTSTRWVVGTKTATFLNPDASDPDFPSSRMTDQKPAFVSKPNASSTLFTVLFAWLGAGIEFDWFGLMNHNLYSLRCTEFRLQIAKNSFFSSGLATLVDRNISTAYSADRRFGDMTLGGGNNRYTNVEYARLQITCSSGIPYIGQVVFGRRRQQKLFPLLAYSADDQSSDIGTVITRSGVRYNTTKYEGRRDIAATLIHENSAVQTDLLAWWTDIEAGELNFFWHDDASTEDDFVMFDMEEDVFRYPYIDNENRRYELVGVEQGPDNVYFARGP